MKKPIDLLSSNYLNDIINFLEVSSFAKFSFDEESIRIEQNDDHKVLSLKISEVEKVIQRKDFDNSVFIQINFSNKTKLLLTKNLIGFKPFELLNFDSSKIPRVVTTMDLKSVFKAIEDLSDEEDTYKSATELEVMKKVYQSIMLGAESIGFDMKNEKLWFSSYLLNPIAASA